MRPLTPRFYFVKHKTRRLLQLHTRAAILRLLQRYLLTAIYLPITFVLASHIIAYILRDGFAYTQLLCRSFRLPRQP